MQIETIGKYQFHLIAHEISASGRWDPFLTVMKFDDEIQDFRCVVEKRHITGETYDDYNDAIEAARRAGNALIASGQI
jgi:hypothetical protein